MAITPDTKDWTWVLERPCPECGFDPDELTPQDVAGRVDAALPRWDAALQRADVRDRPNESTWSPLEYGCHVRDVFGLFRTRLGLMLAEDGARFADWDQDATALEKDYGASDPDSVRAELAEEGALARDAFGAVPQDAFARRGLRSNGSEFTVVTLARYFLHDVEHHLHDVAG
ncbi:DinB family protein [Sinomonas sp. R1AF57]|uniref:DinB family protein n=1 Tax=Sinomonas sp. R1AF57 TaxID=2020377 RepID=UPI000B617A20|nr:DinB family protein [Sinomonas sp. R1AF57]ASN51814.1 methyltransferase type 12 [Sinomonas sp. R1AF57]